MAGINQSLMLSLSMVVIASHDRGGWPGARWCCVASGRLDMGLARWAAWALCCWPSPSTASPRPWASRAVARATGGKVAPVGLVVRLLARLRAQPAERVPHAPADRPTAPAACGPRNRLTPRVSARHLRVPASSHLFDCCEPGCGGGRAGLLHSNHCSTSSTTPTVSAVSLRARQHIAKALAVGVVVRGCQAPYRLMRPCPARGHHRSAIQSSIAEEAFQTILPSAGGSWATPSKRRRPSTPPGHRGSGNGDATFMATHWDPLYADFYRNAGGDDSCGGRAIICAIPCRATQSTKRRPTNTRSPTSLATVDPALAKLFDTNGDAGRT